MFSPVNKLPPEVLGRVFEFTIAPESESFEYLFEYPPSTAPHQVVWYDDIIFVSTWWYKVATKWPRMWYHILGDRMVDRDHAMIPTTCYHPQAVLRRSGETPLHLYMAMSPHPTPESVPQWVIKNKPLRVEALHISLRDASRQYEALLELLVTRFPSLRLLTVDAY